MDGVEVHAPRRDRVREVEFVSGKGLQAAEYGVEPGELAVAAGGGHARIAEFNGVHELLGEKIPQAFDIRLLRSGGIEIR